MSQKLFAEALGTFFLVLFGCGAAVLMGDKIGMHGISMAFGIGVIAAAYGLGAISGAHLNPAVTIGMVSSGRMQIGEAVGYMIAQVIGAVIAAFILLMIAKGAPGYDVAVNGLGQNGFGPGYNGEYNLAAALIFEFVMTFVFVTVILGSTSAAAPAGFAGLAIGLTLVGIHLVGINVTGVSVNPARSIGPALFAGSRALGDLWVFIVAPLAGGVVAGLVYAAGLTRPHNA